MKRQIIKSLKGIVRDTGRDEYIRSLATGKFYKNGHEVTEVEWNQIPNKIIRIDLGPGQKPKAI